MNVKLALLRVWLLAACFVLPGFLAKGQPVADPLASLVGCWTNQEGAATTRFDVRSGGKCVFSRQEDGRTQASMGACRITANIIVLNPDSPGARRWKYELLDANTLRIREDGGAAIVLQRGQSEASGYLGPSSGALPGLVPTPDWLSRTLANPPKFTAPTNQPTLAPRDPKTDRATNVTSLVVGGLSESELAMANAVIAENTLTLSLPGLGTSADGPGELTSADRLVLLALKLHQQRHALVPFGEMRMRLEQAESRLMYRQVGEEFWAWFREAAQKPGATSSRSDLKSDFGTYIAMKVTAKRKATNRIIAGQVGSEVAWRRAVESDRRFRDKVAQTENSARQMREANRQEWNLSDREAIAAQEEWQSYLNFGDGHMRY